LIALEDLPAKTVLAMALNEKARRKAENKLADFRPYKKQLEFYAATSNLSLREFLLMAGNQVGKTLAAAYMTSMHLTGRYPDWWPGSVFDTTTSGWAASETGQGTRDTVQRLLLGRPGAWGTGAIPNDAIKDIKRAQGGVPDLVETILVRHGGGGDVQAQTSSLTLKTYDQGRLRWQGETLDFVWFDEEPPEDIYIEGLTRTNATNGIVWITFTPLLGASVVVRRFLEKSSPGTHVTTMTIDDAEHYTAEQRAAIVASYPAHQRKARAMGIPVLGEGAVFPIDEEAIKVHPFAIPSHWPQIGGIDFGWGHPTAGAKLALDRESDVVYVIADYRKAEATPLIHAAALKPWGDGLPFAWPHDGLQHDKGSGEALADQYRKQGLKMLKDKATHPPKKGEAEGTGGNGVEAGVQEMLERMETGRWKVFSTCQAWFDEFRQYHREDGKIVKDRDDTLCASRYAYMMRRFARVPATRNAPTVTNQFRPRDSSMGTFG
jgi:phage terminase large subunit-like protein